MAKVKPKPRPGKVNTSIEPTPPAASVLTGFLDEIGLHNERIRTHISLLDNAISRNFGEDAPSIEPGGIEGDGFVSQIKDLLAIQSGLLSQLEMAINKITEI